MAYLTQGGLSMQTYGFPTQIVDIISSVIIYFAAFALFFSQTIDKMRHNAKERKAAVVPAAQTEKGGEDQ
jgi:simple sugar transport system permease protein